MGTVGDETLRREAAMIVPGYVVGERIGAGGFGEVFRARHVVIDREVAIKVLHAKYSTSAETVARFVAEARAVGRLSHPGIVDLFEFGSLDDGRQFFVMELIRGRTLRDVLRERGRLPLDEAMPILHGIADAVDAAHAAGIAHRDLKPDNVFVLDGGGVKLIDFGLAKLTREEPAATPMTQTGSVFGTPLYMSPEQCRGKAVTIATDAYSFGVLAYHVLVGEPPFAGDALELALHHLNDDPVLPSKRCSELPDRVDRVLLALLAKDPLERPLPLGPVIAAIVEDGALPDLPLTRSRQRRRWLAGGIAVAIVGTAATVVVLTRDPASSTAPDGCELAADRLARVWGTATRSAVGRRFDAAARLDGPATWRGLSSNLDDYASRWATQWDAACNAADRASEPLLHAQRLACLDNAAIALQSVGEYLLDVDITSYSEKFTGNAVLPILEDCATTAVIRAQVPPPSASQRADVMKLRAEMHRAARDTSFSSEEGPVELERVFRKLEALGSPMAAEAAGWWARTLVRLAVGGEALAESSASVQPMPKRVEAARAALVVAIHRAELDRDDAQLAEDYAERLKLEIAIGTPPRVIEDTLEHGVAALARAGNPIEAASMLTEQQAYLEARQGRLEHAVEILRTATERYERNVNAAGTANPRSWLPPLLSRLGRHAEAVQEARTLLAIAQRLFGDDHFRTIALHGRVEAALAWSGDITGSLREVEVELAGYERLGAQSHAERRPVLLRKYSYAVRLGLAAAAAEAHGELLHAGVTERQIAEQAGSTGMLEAFRETLNRMATSPITDLKRPGIEEARAYLAFMVGDLAAMKHHADGAPAYRHHATGEVDPETLFGGSSGGPWFLALADVAEGNTKQADSRLAALGPHGAGDSSAYVMDAWVLAAMSRWKETRDALEKSRSTGIWGEDWNTAEIDSWLGLARLQTGNLAGAITPLEEALAAAAVCCEEFHYFVPFAKLALAKALWETNGDKHRARVLAEQARDGYARLGTFREPDRQQAIRWLEAHPL